MAKRYTSAEKNFIRKNFEKMTDLQIAKRFGRTENAIAQMRRDYLQITKSRRQWTDEEDKLMLKNMDKTGKELSIMFSRPAKCIYSHKKILELRPKTIDPNRFKNWKPSYVVSMIDPSEYRVAEQQKILHGTYNNPRR